MTNAHRRRNCLKKIKINKRWIEDEYEVRKGIVDTFVGLLSNPGGWHPTLTGLSFKQVGEEAAVGLEVIFSEEEVFAVVSYLNGHKALSPDGFPMAFLHVSWDFVEEEVMRFYKEFYE